MSEVKNTRDVGVYVIVYKTADGKHDVVERGTKREASRTLDGIGFENVVAFYKGAKRIQLKIKQQISF